MMVIRSSCKELGQPKAEVMKRVADMQSRSLRSNPICGPSTLAWLDPASMPCSASGPQRLEGQVGYGNNLGHDTYACYVQLTLQAV